MKSRTIKYTLVLFICCSHFSCEKIYQGIGGGVLQEFTGIYTLTKINEKELLKKDSVVMDIYPRNAQLLSVSFEKQDGTKNTIYSRRNEYNLYKNDKGNNTINAYFPDEEKYMYIEDLTGDKKQKLLLSGLVDEIGGKADTIRYYYTAIQ